MLSSSHGLVATLPFRGASGSVRLHALRHRRPALGEAAFDARRGTGSNPHRGTVGTVLRDHIDHAEVGDLWNEHFADRSESVGANKVINAASDLLADVLGDAGKHSRAAIGVAELPRGVSVEIAAIFVVTDN